MYQTFMERCNKGNRIKAVDYRKVQCNTDYSIIHTNVKKEQNDSN